MHFVTYIAPMLSLLILATAAAELPFDYEPAGSGAVTIIHYKGSDTVVNIPSTIEGKTVVGIGRTAFLGAAVTAVTIPNSVTNIGSHAFVACASLTDVTLSDNLISLGQQSFSECPSLKAINIPATTIEIGSLPFWHSTSLKTINVSADNPNYSSPEGVLLNKQQTTLLIYPPAKAGGYSIPNTVTNIAIYGFSDAWALTSVSIPSSMTAIGYEAFRNTALTNVTVPDSVMKIGYNAFAGCTNLLSAAIGNNVTNIEYGLFVGCLSLTNFVIPSGVVEIDSSAFSGCASLSAINLPAGLTSLGTFVFLGCSNLTSIKIPDSVVLASDYVFQDCVSLTNVIIGSGLGYLTRAMFSGCSSLTHITMPASILQIDAGVFASCPNLEAVYFQGPPPYLPDYRVFTGSDKAVLYYLPGNDWPSEYAERPTALWNPHALLNDPGFGFKNNQFTMPIVGPAGLEVIIEAATDLLNPIWQPVQTATLTADSVVFTDPDSINHSARFYRFRSP